MHLRMPLLRKTGHRSPSIIAAAIPAGILAVALSLAGTAYAASPDTLTGQILGTVHDAAGVAQMGATVYLYDRYDQMVNHALTNEQGRFGFDTLIPEIYSLRVILASFAPAERRNIAVLPNSQNKLEISLASMLSTVTLAPPGKSPGTLMTDDWKWILRSSQATRPILRFLPDSISAPSKALVANFSETTGVLKLSAGDGQSFMQGAGEDLGTAFALATSLAHSARVQFSGNLAYTANNPTMPGAGFRTSYARTAPDGSSPEVVLTMHQLYLANRGTGAVAGTESAPPLRTMSVAILDSLDIADNIQLDYGFDYDSVAYLDHLNYASPFARLTFDGGERGRIRMAYSSGAPPAELLARDDARSSGSDGMKLGELDQDLTALSYVPRVSLSNDHVAVQHTQDFEIGYERVEGPRTYTAGVYHEAVSNAAFMLSSPDANLPAGNLMPDLNSNSVILNVGSYQRTGFDAGVKQMLGDHAEIAMAAGMTGALTLSRADVQDMMEGLGLKQVPWVTVRAATLIPVTGTRITVDYGWTDPGTLIPAHVFITQRINQDVGANIYIRQPLPSILPWRMELTAELRNLLAQGYLPMGSPQSVLTASPRAVRGGLNFIF
jgi:hypothetical protein